MSKGYDLVFEGGGAKGSVFVGALQEFEAQGCKIRRCVGTSAGAITATLVAAGYTADELYDAVNEKMANNKPRFSSFMDTPSAFSRQEIENSLTYEIFRKIDIPFVPGFIESWLDNIIFNLLMKMRSYCSLFSFIEMGGVYAGDNFFAWIREKLNAKTSAFENVIKDKIKKDKFKLGDATLKEFSMITGKDISLVASDTESKNMLVLNSRTAPDCPVAWAVRMSMSIPFVWQEVIWDEAWGKYCGEEITGHTVVDGGVLSNFPINMLTSTDKSIKEVMGDTKPDDAETIGFIIDENIKVENSGEPKSNIAAGFLKGIVIDSFKSLKTTRRTERLLGTMMNAHDMRIIEAHKDEICRLPAKGYGVTEFDMSDERMDALICAGREAMKGYFAACESRNASKEDSMVAGVGKE